MSQTTVHPAVTADTCVRDQSGDYLHVTHEHKNTFGSGKGATPHTLNQRWFYVGYVRGELVKGLVGVTRILTR